MQEQFQFSIKQLNSNHLDVPTFVQISENLIGVDPTKGRCLEKLLLLFYSSFENGISNFFLFSSVILPHLSSLLTRDSIKAELIDEFDNRYGIEVANF